MTFLNTNAFWGFFLLAIPILIHLFSFRKVKKLFFSNVSFLSSVKSKSNVKNNLRKWLILSLRLLALAFLILAFSQPMWQELEGASERPNRSVFYLDNSLSMGRNSEEGNDLITNGVVVLGGLTDKLQANERLMLLTNDVAGLNRPILKKEVQDKIAEVNLSNRNQSVQEVIAKCGRLYNEVSDIYLISDFQKTSFKNIQECFEDTMKRYHLIKINALNNENLYVDSVILDNPIGFPTDNKFRISIRNVGDENRQDVLVKVFKGEVQISSFTQNLSAGSREWVEVDLTESAELSGSYKVEVSDSEFVYDNRYYFEVGAFVKPKVYQVYRESPNRYIKNVYSNPEFFDLSVSSIGNVDQERLLSADLVVLDGIGQIPSWLNNQLRNFKNSLLLIPNETTVQQGFYDLFREQVMVATDTSSGLVNSQSLHHPFFNSVFNKKDEQSNMPWFKSALDLKSGTDVILKSVLGQPLLAEYEGSRFVLSFPLEDRYTNLHKHGLFLPLMYKLSVAHKTSPVYSFEIDDELLAIENDSLIYAANIELRNGEVVIVPVLRNIEGGLFLEMPEIMEQPGFYELYADGVKVQTLAFNLPKDESEVSTFSDAEISLMVDGRSNVTFESVDNGFEEKAKYAAIDSGFPLWKYALLLALVFLIVELTLLRIFR
ncbi:MAG: BatA domain-containing protein [Cyclobacteriaceae bacterium]